MNRRCVWGSGSEKTMERVIMVLQNVLFYEKNKIKRGCFPAAFLLRACPFFFLIEHDSSKNIYEIVVDYKNVPEL